MASSVGELSEKTIPFTIFRVSADDPFDTVFLISKSNVFKHGIVMIRKNGTFQLYHPADAIDPILQHLPGIHPKIIGKSFDGKMLPFMVFPVADDDPADTVFAVYKSEVSKDDVVVLEKGGDAQRYRASDALDMILLHLSPSHPPAFLP